jgi:hypothetical protein
MLINIFITGSNVTAVSAGLASTSALLADGTLFCWGSNAFGELGLETIANVGDMPGQMWSFLMPVNLSGTLTRQHIMHKARLKRTGSRMLISCFSMLFRDSLEKQHYEYASSPLSMHGMNCCFSSLADQPLFIPVQILAPSQGTSGPPNVTATNTPVKPVCSEIPPRSYLPKMCWD